MRVTKFKFKENQYTYIYGLMEIFDSIEFNNYICLTSENIKSLLLLDKKELLKTLEIFSEQIKFLTDEITEIEDKEYKNKDTKIGSVQNTKRSKISNSDKIKIFNKYNSKCYYCGIEIKYYDSCIDHKIPVIKNGSNSLDNLVLSCKKCNSSKGKKTINEFKKYKSIEIFAGEKYDN